MSNQMNMVSHEEFGELEILIIDGKPYFAATDCAIILGYSNPRDAISKHCRYVAKRDVPHPQSPAKTLQRNFIPEGDLYRLIIRSKLPAAEKFERWVFDDVLPSIREHGVYATEEAVLKILSDPKFAYGLFRKLEAERGKNAMLELELEETAPKAEYYDNVLQRDDLFPVTLIAKDYGFSACEFNRLLHSLGIQFKVGGTWALYKNYANHGYTQSRTYYSPNGKVVMHTCWTQKGREFLYDALAYFDIYPVDEDDDFDFDYDYEIDND